MVYLTPPFDEMFAYLSHHACSFFRTFGHSPVGLCPNGSG